jgi:NurA-like 5'-3' nuclease
MDTGEGKQSADVVSAKKGSAQEEYYRYMLLQAKLHNLGKPDNEVDPLLKVQSEREVIEMSILRKLLNITESSPEFSQVVDITGSRDRYEQARILSEVVYDKVRAETILSFYTPDKGDMESYFKDITKASATSRMSKLANASSTATVLSVKKDAYSKDRGT